MSSVQIPQAALLNEYAIVVDPKDNVAVVKKETTAGLELLLPDNTSIEIREVIPPGHRFATKDIRAGELVLQFGQPIGTSLGIQQGEQISHNNMSDEVPVVRDLPHNLHTPAPEYFPAAECATFMGFRRPDGRVGTRNYVLI